MLSPQLRVFCLFLVMPSLAPCLSDLQISGCLRARGQASPLLTVLPDDLPSLMGLNGVHTQVLFSAQTSLRSSSPTRPIIYLASLPGCLTAPHPYHPVSGIQGFCKDLLEVADILEKATQCVPKEEIKDDNPHLKNLYEGLVMTEVQIQKVFTKHGLLRLNPLGAKFDPYEHEALFHTPVEGKEPGTVALVNKVGYKLHGRTLRPALVGVVKEA
uniref:GrpE protein homolog n=1 Tax=Equus caballus TaxID=9796 RepID=A0A9L0RU88_HORSE